jgi:two-component system chemotaxis response regulator CheB
MSGLETLAAIRKTYPRLPVIMFSTLTEGGAGTTLDALALGASDYVTKPHHTGSVEVTRARIQAELVPKVKVLCTQPHPWTRSAAVTQAWVVGGSASVSRPPQPVGIVAVGTSTGGPNALAELPPALSAGFPVPLVVVQHMPPLFTRMLADRLDKRSQLRIHEGAEGDV